MGRIFLGPAGNCGTAPSHTTQDSIKYVVKLGLTAQELEFVRSIYLNDRTAKEVGDMAKQLKVRLSIHAPYFINLSSEKKSIVENSKRLILMTAEIGEIVGADAIAIHSGYYGKLTKEKTYEMIRDGFKEILEKMRDKGIRNVKLGTETMAKESQFGTLDETIEMCKELKHVVPYIDWAHLFVRNGGKVDYSEVFDKLKALKLDHVNSHFEGVKYNISTKKFVDVHVPIGMHPPFEPLAKEIIKRNVDITIISESPVLEMDSLKEKKILEKMGHKF